MGVFHYWELDILAGRAWKFMDDIDTDAILKKMKEKFSDQQVTDIDGVKIDFPDKWVHLRKSNTEPIIRVYSEAYSPEEAEEIGKQIIDLIRDLA